MQHEIYVKHESKTKRLLGNALRLPHYHFYFLMCSYFYLLLFFALRTHTQIECIKITISLATLESNHNLHNNERMKTLKLHRLCVQNFHYTLYCIIKSKFCIQKK